jgi:hypothetical protein
VACGRTFDLQFRLEGLRVLVGGLLVLGLPPPHLRDQKALYGLLKPAMPRPTSLTSAVPIQAQGPLDEDSAYPLMPTTSPCRLRREGHTESRQGASVFVHLHITALHMTWVATPATGHCLKPHKWLPGPIQTLRPPFPPYSDRSRRLDGLLANV